MAERNCGCVSQPSAPNCGPTRVIVTAPYRGTRCLTAAYNEVLSRFDLLLMPTTPIKAMKLPEPGAPCEEIILRAYDMLSNTVPLDISHHPVMAIPCGMSDGLPISIMLVGRHRAEATIYRAAQAFESSGNWRTM